MHTIPMKKEQPKTYSKNGPYKTICCATGKSGGHIIPNLTLAQQKKAKRTIFFSNTTPLDYKLLKDTVDLHIPLHIPRLNSLLHKLIFPFAFCWSFLKSFYFLAKEQPDVILSTGGIEALPVCIAGWLLRVPIELYEMNAIPGKAIRFLAPLATNIFVCFKSSQQFFKNAKRHPYPIRFKKTAPIEIPQFKKNRKTILLLGGSQGSCALNDALLNCIENEAIAKKIQIMHQYGFDERDWKKIYAELGIPAIVFDFTNTIDTYYPHADLVICRSGAGSLFETAYFNKPCITIPLKNFGAGHQIANAKAMAQENDLFEIGTEKMLGTFFGE